ncbi:MAG: SRPBCC family protein [Verrucomicrobiota bacterium]
MVIISVFFGIAAAVVFTIILTPRVVEYVESVEIRSCPETVYDSIRFQRDLMRWSAWPTETGSRCQTDGTDGEIHAKTIFLDKKGTAFGYQSITEVIQNQKISFSLESKGPPHIPTLDFHIIPIDNQLTRVLLHFRNDITPPFHFFLKLFGIVRWTRKMHEKDLDGLKRFIERSEDYQGNPI